MNSKEQPQEPWIPKVYHLNNEFQRTITWIMNGTATRAMNSKEQSLQQWILKNCYMNHEWNYHKSHEFQKTYH